MKGTKIDRELKTQQDLEMREREKRGRDREEESKIESKTVRRSMGRECKQEKERLR